jgi:type II secretion system protein G
MVVVVILGILAALVVPKIISRPDEARVIAAKQDIASLMQALKLYRLDNQRYPTTEQGLQALAQTGGTDPANWKPAATSSVAQDPGWSLSVSESGRGKSTFSVRRRWRARRRGQRR